MKNIIGFGLLLLLCHCASVSTMQTAEVLPVGESSHAVGVGTYSSDDFVGGDDISLPLIEYAYRRGMWDDIDVGLKLALIGSITADMKYNFLKSGDFAMATGLGLGYLNFESESMSVTQKVTIIDLILPLYVSYNVAKMTSLYTAAKYIFRAISSDFANPGDGGLLSASLGVKIGDTSGLFLEGSLISGIDNDFTGTQLNGAYFFSF